MATASGSSGSAAERSMEGHFLKLARKGVIPSLEDLGRYNKARKLGLSSDYLRGLRRRFDFSAPFQRVRTRPPAYLKNLHPKYGQVMVDLAFYRSEWKRHNGGVKGERKMRQMQREEESLHCLFFSQVFLSEWR